MTDTKEKVAASIVRARAELEQALFDLDEMSALDPAKIAKTAHALNNFLTVTGATVELLQFSLKDYPDPKVRNWLEGLRHATSLMIHTVSQLMNASVSAEVKLRLAKTDLPTLIQRACTYYQRIADRKQIRINCVFQDERLYAWTDIVAVAAILDNLLSNAVKYSPAGRSIWLKVYAEPAHIVCSLRDEGPGLSKNDQSKLFQGGVRLSSVPTGGEPSTGYGLAVAKELIDKLDGEIWCESEIGKGCCFSFRLPVYKEQVHGQEE